MLATEAAEENAFALDLFPIKKAAAVGTPKSILIYGLAKRGKSVMAASIVDVPGFERTLLVDVEGGSASISAWHPNVDVIEAGTHERFNAIIEALLSGKLVEPSTGLPYQAVIIDTLDKAQERALEVFDKDPRGIVNGKRDGFFKWAAVKAWTTKIGDLLHMADFLTIFVAHQEDDKDETTGAVTTTVMLQGKSRFTFPSTPDIIGHFKVLEVKGEDGKKAMKRAIDFKMDNKFISGQRYADKLDGVFVEPTFVRIFEKIQPERFKK